MTAAGDKSVRWRVSIVDGRAIVEQRNGRMCRGKWDAHRGYLLEWRPYKPWLGTEAGKVDGSRHAALASALAWARIGTVSAADAVKQAAERLRRATTDADEARAWLTRAERALESIQALVEEESHA